MKIKEGERAVISNVRGDFNFKSYLLANGITKGTVITLNYSPGFSRLINISVGGRMLGLRQDDFRHLDLEIIT